MTADQTLANIDATLDHVSRYDLVAGGVVDGAVSMRWRPRTTAVGPGWVPSLPVTFQEITEADAVERQVVEPMRRILATATEVICVRCLVPYVDGHNCTGWVWPDPGERSHLPPLGADGSSSGPRGFSVRSLLRRLVGR